MKKITGYLIILGGGPQQLPAYEVADELGIKTICVDKNSDAICKTRSEFFVNLSIKNSIPIIKYLLELDLEYAGVITCGAEVSPQVSQIASYFGLKGIPEKIAEQTTNKFLRSNVLHDAGVNIPNFELITNNIHEKYMPTLIGVGDTVTSSYDESSHKILRGGSDRGFLTLISMLNSYYGKHNKVILVNSSGGEVNRPNISLDNLNGVSDVDDPLNIDYVFKDGPSQYIEWFSYLSKLLK